MTSSSYKGRIRVRQVRFDVSSAAWAERFYASILGLPVLFREYDGERLVGIGICIVSELEGYETILLLTESASVRGSIRERSKALHAHHDLEFDVDNLNMFHVRLESFIESGIVDASIVTITRSGGECLGIVVRDTDGNSVLISQRTTNPPPGAGTWRK